MTIHTEKEGIFTSVCSLDCPDQCGLLIHKKEGKIIKVEGDPNHPVTQGNICNKVRNMAERLYDPKRLTHPLKRTGPKGSLQFEEISWDDALQIITDKWKDLIKTHGPESILPYSFYGNMGRVAAEGMDRRFFSRLGASRLEQTVCQAAGKEGYRYTMGGGFGTDPEETSEAKLIILWGINAVSTNMHQVILARKAKKHGAKIIVIDVHKNQTGKMADWFIPIKPGTDSALALGMMHILFAEHMVDEEFLETYTIGHEQLRTHVKKYTPEVVSSITGVSIDDLYQLAREYGQSTPSFIRIGNGLQHHDNGGMNVRAISCLPALTGQWLHKGGGALKSNSGFLAFNTAAMQRPDLLANKQTRSINMNLIGEALVQKDEPIRSMYVYGSNPAVIAPNSNLVKKGLEREDLFLVVHDLFLTETAQYADIILPSTSSYENTDFYTSYWHHYIHLHEPVIEPYGESRSNHLVFQQLAHYMGYTEDLFKDSEEDLITSALANTKNEYMKEINFERLNENRFMKADVRPLLPGKLKTPSGKIELYSELMEKDGLNPLPTYNPIVDEGDAPFLFVPAPNHNFLNSTFSNNDKHIKLEKQPKLHLHSKDAQAYQIEDGDLVKIFNDRGECELTAAVGENVLPGVVVSQGLWADEPGKKHLVNTLTPDRVADMGGGATFFSGRVYIEKVISN